MVAGNQAYIRRDSTDRLPQMRRAVFQLKLDIGCARHRSQDIATFRAYPRRDTRRHHLHDRRMPWQHIRIARFGEPEVLELAERPIIPEPGPGEVRIKVLAAGTGFTDSFIRRGRYPDFKGPLPFTPGYDIVGVGEKIGHRLPPGAAVLVIAASGTAGTALLDPGVRRRSNPALPQPTR
jgi:hypothetical protein